MPEARLERTRQAYKSPVVGSYEWAIECERVRLGDWKAIPSVVTAADADAFDIDRAYREKRAQSDEAFEKFRQDFMK